MEGSFTLVTWFWLLVPLVTIVLSAVSLARQR
jgi:hypothetical protein